MQLSGLTWMSTLALRDYWQGDPAARVHNPLNVGWILVTLGQGKAPNPASSGLTIPRMRPASPSTSPSNPPTPPPKNLGSKPRPGTAVNLNNGSLLNPSRVPAMNLHNADLPNRRGTAVNLPYARPSDPSRAPGDPISFDFPSDRSRPAMPTDNALYRNVGRVCSGIKPYLRNEPFRPRSFARLCDDPPCQPSPSPRSSHPPRRHPQSWLETSSGTALNFHNDSLHNPTHAPVMNLHNIRLPNRRGTAANLHNASLSDPSRAPGDPIAFDFPSDRSCPAMPADNTLYRNVGAGLCSNRTPPRYAPDLSSYPSA